MRKMKERMENFGGVILVEKSEDGKKMKESMKK